MQWTAFHQIVNWVLCTKKLSGAIHAFAFSEYLRVSLLALRTKAQLGVNYSIDKERS